MLTEIFSQCYQELSTQAEGAEEEKADFKPAYKIQMVQSASGGMGLDKDEK